jgi:hypothetical protein
MSEQKIDLVAEKAQQFINDNDGVGILVCLIDFKTREVRRVSDMGWHATNITLDSIHTQLQDEVGEVEKRGNSEDTAFIPPFGTVRVCRGCGCLVAGGPTICVRCAEKENQK